MRTLVFLLFVTVASTTLGQTIPISTQTLLDGVKSRESKAVIKSVLMLVCGKDSSKGTAFVLAGGQLIVSNSHVVGTCTAGDLRGISSVTNDRIQFTGLVKDDTRDLALLCATKPLPFSLELNGDDNPAVETEVETWGYPLRYQDPAPVLSRGYVAGYSTTVRANGSRVKHLIVNGALNPGNSGGPLIDRNTGRVIGVVVEKWMLFSPMIEEAIKGFSNPRARMGGTFSRTDEHGNVVGVSDQEVLAEVLKEFYSKSQVMVGEAISVSELNLFIKDKRKELTCEAH